jgi:hypothetical protein
LKKEEDFRGTDVKKTVKIMTTKASVKTSRQPKGLKPVRKTVKNAKKQLWTK